MSVCMPTAEEIQRWSPKARPDYIKAFLSGEQFLREAGVLEDRLTLCHFMGQTGGETNGWQIVRENLNYTSVKSIRSSWKARAAKHSNAWINMNLVRKPMAIGEWAYGGRMGNKKVGSDGYNMRGGGFLQTTGRWAVETYAKKLGLPVNDLMLDDAPTTLRFACEEWRSSGCSSYALKNDILSVAKIINTGSAKSGIRPNGMEHRELWFSKAWKIWGDPARETMARTSAVTRETLKKQGSETVKSGETIENAGKVVLVGTGIVKGLQETGVTDVVEPVTATKTVVEQIKDAGDTSSLLTSAGQSIKSFVQFIQADFWVVALVLGCVAVYFGRHIIARRIADARMGLHIGRVPDEPDPDPISDSTEPVGAG